MCDPPLDRGAPKFLKISKGGGNLNKNWVGKIKRGGGAGKIVNQRFQPEFKSERMKMGTFTDKLA